MFNALSMTFFIVAVSCIEGGNRSIRRKPSTGFELTTFVMIATHCIGNCKSSYHVITTTAAPKQD